MNNIKGIIFSLESVIKSGKKQLLTNKVMIDPDEVFSLIEKLKDAVVHYETKEKEKSETRLHDLQQFEGNDSEIVNAQKLAFKMRNEANDYADGVLSRLQLLVTKLQKNVIRVEKNILEGRKLIEQQQIQQAGDNLNET